MKALKDVYEKVIGPIDWAERTEQVGKRVVEVLKAVDPQKGEAGAGKVGAAKQQIKARMDGCVLQMQSTQLSFSLSKRQTMCLEPLAWTSQEENARFSKVSHNGRKVMLIQATGEK